MANKLKNMRLTSVDLVRSGANQEADICLFKSADPAEAPYQPTERETNILKRFIEWLGINPTAAEEETVEKDYSTFGDLTANRENQELLWRYTSALTESIQSIQNDHDLDSDQKLRLMLTSLDEFDEAMEELLESLCKSKPSTIESATAKSAPEEEEDGWDFDDDTPEEEEDPEEETPEEEDPEEEIDEIEEV